MYIGIIAPTLERKHSPTKQRFELYHHVNTLSGVSWRDRWLSRKAPVSSRLSVPSLFLPVTSSALVCVRLGRTHTNTHTHTHTHTHFHNNTYNISHEDPCGCLSSFGVGNFLHIYCWQFEISFINS